MSLLKGASVKRGGSTAYYWYETIETVFVETAAELRLKFSMSSKGGGRTQVQLELKPESFPTILEKMAAVDPEAAVQAMAAELSRQIKLQPQRHSAELKAAEKKAVDDIQDRARKRYSPNLFGRPEGDDRIIYNGIRTIISEASAARSQS